MTPAAFNVGTYVLGPPTAPRALVRHGDLLTAYADGDVPDESEAYLSHFAFGADLQSHFAGNRQSVAGFAGPCWCRWLVLDLDRADLAEALADARRLVAFISERYGIDPPIYFSGGKGFHVLIELAHNPPPAVGFHRIAKTFAEALSAAAGVRIDTSIFGLAHIIRLPNTRHPRSGLFKRRVEADALFRLDVAGILAHARQPAGDGLPALRSCPAKLASDWQEAEGATARAAEARAGGQARAMAGGDTRAPRYLVDFLRFGTDAGQRHQTLFRCAAWLTEQGAPPALVAALLTEPGRDVGLTPKDVDRQITCGIDHARKQGAGPADVDAAERWAIAHEADPLPPGALEFPFGALALTKSEGGLVL